MPIFQGRVQLQDEHGLTATKLVQMNVDSAVHITTIAQITAALNALNDFVTLLDGVIDAVILSATLSVPVTAGGKANPGDQGVAEGATLQLTTLKDGVEYVRPYWLPSAKAGIFNSNFRTIDTGDAELLAFLGAFDNNDVLIEISDGEEVTGIDSGHYSTRRRSVS